MDKRRGEREGKKGRQEGLFSVFVREEKSGHAQTRLGDNRRFVVSNAPMQQVGCLSLFIRAEQ